MTKSERILREAVEKMDRRILIDAGAALRESDAAREDEEYPGGPAGERFDAIYKRLAALGRAAMRWVNSPVFGTEEGLRQLDTILRAAAKCARAIEKAKGTK